MKNREPPSCIVGFC